MDNMNQLRDLLKHEINDLYSAEEQIIEALPAMIGKAKDRKLKKALQDHLKVTEFQKQRLDEVLLKLEDGSGSGKKGLFSGLFSSKKCKGMQGLIAEGEKIMREDMSPDVMDAAIVAGAQKIEHYEISAYGTARAYAEELRLNEVEKLLKQTLDEEYEADDLLSELAVSRLNREAMPGAARKTNSRGNSSSQQRKTTGRTAKKTASKTAKKKNSKRSSARKKTVA